MRDYAKIAPKLWTGNTGKQLRKSGPEALLVAVYLMSAPGSNMLGLYYQPMLYMAHETGLGVEGLAKGLRACVEAGFCRYDEPTEMVWVVEMAAYQIAPVLKATDNRCAGIQKDYDALQDNPFLGAFFDRYAGPYHLTRRRESKDQPQAPSQAPPKPGTGTGTGTSSGTEAGSESTPIGVLVEPAAPIPPVEPEKSRKKPKRKPDEPHPDDAPEGDAEPVDRHADLLPLCPQNKVRELWAKLLPEMPQHTVWHENRKVLLRVRWKEAAKQHGWKTEEEGLRYFSKLFRHISTSPFLTGRASARDGRAPFQAELEWVLKAGNMAKIIDGKYHQEG